MSAFDKAKCLITPTAWDTDTLNFVLPELPYTSNRDIVVNGDFASATSWTVGSAWTITGGQAVLDAPNNNASVLSQTISNGQLLVSSRTYLLEYEIVSYTDGGLGFGNALTSLYALNTTVGVHTLEFTGVSGTFGFHAQGTKPTVTIDNVKIYRVVTGNETGTPVDGVFYRNTASFRKDSNYELTAQAIGIPRPQYDINDRGYFLVEDTSTNINGFSYLTSTGWSPGANAVRTTAVSDPTPAGTDAITLASSNGGGTGTVTIASTTNFGVVNGAKSTFSVYAKTNGSKYVGLATRNFTSPGDVVSVFDITGGTVFSQATGHEASVDVVGNGWVRCIVTITGSADTTGNCDVYVCDNATGSTTCTLNGTDSVDLYGFQFENYPVATSLIDTTGLQKTRTDDELYLVGATGPDAGVFNSVYPAGTLYAEFQCFDDGKTKCISCGDDATGTTDYVRIDIDTNNELNYVVRVNNSDVFSGNLAGTNALNWNKMAVRWAANDFAVWLNGTEVATSGSGATFTDYEIRNMSLDDNNGGSPFLGKIRSFGVFEGLTDGELAILTSTSV